MQIIHQILIMLLTLGVLIAIHEFGHYWVAKKCGVKVLRFSLGFGPVIYRWINNEGTEFAVSVLPLGGYVKMLDEAESTVNEDEKFLAFNNKTVYQRIAIVSAGPIANFILAIFVYWLLFLKGTVGLSPVLFSVKEDSEAAMAGLSIGHIIVSVDDVETSTVNAVAMQLMKRIGDDGNIKLTVKRNHSDVVSEHSLNIKKWLGNETGSMDFFTSLGFGFYQPLIAPVIEEVLPDSAAQMAGLLKGDELISVDGIIIKDWIQWVEYVRKKADVTINVKVSRMGTFLIIPVKPELISDSSGTYGQVGVRVQPPVIPVELLVKEQYNVLTAWIPALDKTWQTALFSLQSLKKMLMGDISYKQLSGPVSIAKVASESANSGIYSYLSLLALLSVSLGVLNLLPVPVLDGGHILFYLIEWFKGSPVPEKIAQAAYQFGMLVVLSVMVLALFNDLSRL